MSTTGNREDGITTYITPETDEAEMLEEARYQAAVRELFDSDSQEIAEEYGNEQPELESEIEDGGESIDSTMNPEQAIPTLSLCVKIYNTNSDDEIAATADVEINGICTIRNVKIKNSDYGLEVVMPRTKMPNTGRYRDSCVFPMREMRNQFDMAVLNAYQQDMALTQEQEFGAVGMRM